MVGFAAVDSWDGYPASLAECTLSRDSRPS